MAHTGPIFIHSLFRCASTYFFQKARALGTGFTCYQEPFNESLEALNRPRRHARLLAPPDGAPLRHPRLDQPYFYEFWLRRRQLRGLYRRAFAYQEYFGDPSLARPQQRWIAALLAHAQGRPVLQCCRSSGRAAALRAAFGGVHLHLWREPRAQWWSYKIADYFDSVSRRIYQAPGLPPPLVQLRQGVLGHGGALPLLSARQNYALYYGLWLHSWLTLSDQADACVSVDWIALREADNRSCAARLTDLLGERIDLSDIRASGMAFAADELPFYESVEHRVGELFVSSGYAGSRQVRSAENAAAEVRLAHARCAHDALAERNLRQAALSMMERMQREGLRPRQSRYAVAGAAWTPLTDIPHRIWSLLSGCSEAGRISELLSGAPLLLPGLGTEAARNGYHRD